jgi:hypothetical protein
MEFSKRNGAPQKIAHDFSAVPAGLAPIAADNPQLKLRAIVGMSRWDENRACRRGVWICSFSRHENALGQGENQPIHAG